LPPWAADQAVEPGFAEGDGVGIRIIPAVGSSGL